MNYRRLFVPALLVVSCLTAAVCSIAFAGQDANKQPAGEPQFPLPPGWTAADLEAMMAAGTPGEQHKLLAKGAGEWTGKVTMWMYPDAEPMKSDCTWTVTPIMDGRYFKAEIKGDMAGMGPYHGAGIYGYDNVTRKFVTSWIDNHSTGIMNGTGELSDDRRKLTWDFMHNCPIAKKPVPMREVETFTGANTKTLEMFGAEPKSGKEFQMMRIEFTRK
jgi:hypothetical protein